MPSFTIQALYNHFASSKESGWILKPDNAKHLFAFVKKHQPKNILDLGTGVGLSAAVVSLALEGKEHHVHTVEQFEKCHKLAQELIPEELRKNTTFHHQEATVWEHPETHAIPTSLFKELPEAPEGGWDLIIVDGPGPWLQDGKLIEVPNGDVLKLHSEGKIKEGTKIYFDGRIPALGLIERFYSKDFWLLGSIGGRINFLECKSEKPNFEDERKKGYEKDGYFG